MVELQGSMAGSNQVYAGNDTFRIRKNGETLRIHVAREAVRFRDDYIAMDLDLADLIAAAALVANGI